MRIVTGAFRTSPTASILAEANEPPLDLRRKTLGMRYTAKLRQFPNHSTYKHVFSRELLRAFRGGNSASSIPLCVRMHDAFDESGISLRSITRVSTLSVPPWQLTPPVVDTSLSSIRKDEISPTEFRLRALEVINRFRDYSVFYTDGSRTDTGVGCAFVHGQDVRAFTLPPHATVYSAELVAISKTLSFIEVCDTTLHVIFSDSLSSLVALNNIFSQHPIVQDILKRLDSLYNDGKIVRLCWIPSHVGIIGNERADKAARRATEARYRRRLPLPAADFFPSIRSYILEKWQYRWDSQPRNKLREIKPRLGAWSSSLRGSRRQEVLLSRIRIGHTYDTHHYLLCGDDRPLCPRCGDPLSVRHVLTECRGLVAERTQFFGRSVALTLRGLLGELSMSIDDVLAFISHIRLNVIYAPI